MPKNWKLKSQVTEEILAKIRQIFTENPHLASGHLPPEGKGICDCCLNCCLIED